ncbi:unnamed protein product [Amoebophrya sp. A120]|nr:unnamed protein product [Amoebophrya sp. A120]|eukprot:GSA120T00000944001.1
MNKLRKQRSQLHSSSSAIASVDDSYFAFLPQRVFKASLSPHRSFNTTSNKNPSSLLPRILKYITSTITPFVRSKMAKKAALPMKKAKAKAPAPAMKKAMKKAIASDAAARPMKKAKAAEKRVPAMKKAMKKVPPMKQAAKNKKIVVAMKKVVKKPASMKVMKTTKKRGAKKNGRESKIAKGKLARRKVLAGSKEKTQGGLTKDDLRKNKYGKIVSAKVSENGKKMFKNIHGWNRAMKMAREYLNVDGFCPAGGSSVRGKAFLGEVRRFYAKIKAEKSNAATPPFQAEIDAGNSNAGTPEDFYAAATP